MPPVGTKGGGICDWWCCLRGDFLNAAICTKCDLLFQWQPFVPFVWADASLRSLSPTGSHTKSFVLAFWVPAAHCGTTDGWVTRKTSLAVICCGWERHWFDATISSLGFRFLALLLGSLGSDAFRKNEANFCVLYSQLICKLKGVKNTSHSELYGFNDFFRVHIFLKIKM
ncbi:hypothetical protein NPIL_663771 [Nephila pilipes]|uniref:Uncharacterized protein n=1 Tax=Nephila pilipes TaxID=299642 RepID=A0A8X6QV32_NEPPI|nr:hypothetical protein NPIL_663771 [Nephila pilipes]